MIPSWVTGQYLEMPPPPWAWQLEFTLHAQISVVERDKDTWCQPPHIYINKYISKINIKKKTCSWFFLGTLSIHRRQVTSDERGVILTHADESSNMFTGVTFYSSMG